MSAEIIGYVAATLSVTAFLPQAWKVIKTRETKELSTPMWILEICAFAMWIAYGVAKSALPIIIPNVICFILAGFILVMKLLPEKKRNKVADVLDPTVSTG
ncbi:MAG: SemiSWEET transporter [Deltaproteobacteria bacterium]|nr:SemiSWEET transporter [Deltaproteobacteria bacterium]